VGGELCGHVHALAVVQPLVLQAVPQCDEPYRLTGGIAVGRQVAVLLRRAEDGGEMEKPCAK